MILLAASAQAAQYYVRTDGADTNDGRANAADTGGTTDQAWLTISKASTTMVAGDTVTVVAGTYNENLTTGASGTSPSKITYNTSGTVYIYTVTFNHAYNVIDGFTIRHGESESGLVGQITVNDNGDNCTVTNCTIGPGGGGKWTDLAFVNSNPDTITSATGGFLAAGIRSGLDLRVWDAYGETGTANDQANFTVTGVTDNTITLDAAEAVVAETGAKAHFFTINTTVFFRSGSANFTFSDNLVTAARANWMNMNGSGHLIEENIFEKNHGQTGIQFGGSNITLRRNLIRDSFTPEGFYPSPDAIVYNSPSTFSNVLVEENMIIDFNGNIDYTHGIPTTGPITWRKNVFVNTGGGHYSELPGAIYDRNTFYRVAYINTPTSPLANHPIWFPDENGNVASTTITSNLFIGCGYNTTSTNGWYQIDEPGLVLTADYNFVAGASPGFASKTGFSETNGINGGDPMFVDINDPLGPDGIIFTADDGLRLAAGSPAIGAGPAGADLGAYDYDAGGSPTGTINATTTNAGTVTVGP